MRLVDRNAPPPVTPAEEPPVAINAVSPVRYPPALLEQGIEGQVLLRLYVDSAGHVIPDSTRIAESSGYPALDSAALVGVARASVLSRAASGTAYRRALHSAGTVPRPPRPTQEPDSMSQPQHLKPYESVLDTVGWTPLIRLARLGAGSALRSTARPSM